MFPEQPEWERKEQLYLRIIDYFDKGKVKAPIVSHATELHFNAD